MARASDQIRSSDVTYWGMVALACCAVAVVSANVSAIVPDGVLGGLHSNRLQGGSLNLMRAQIARMDVEQARLQAANEDLAARLALAERAAGDVTRRVGAVEASLPDIIAKQNAIDSSSVTASTQNPAPLFAVEPSGAQPLPPAVGGSQNQQAAWGVAVGRPVGADGAPAEWSRITLKGGALLLGLAPLLDTDGGVAGRLVAGPVASETRALALCNELARSDIACAPVAYTGAELQ